MKLFMENICFPSKRTHYETSCLVCFSQPRPSIIASILKVFELASLAVVFIAAVSLAVSPVALGQSGQIVNPSSYEQLRQDTNIRIKNKIDPLLVKYCGSACELVQSKLDIMETLGESEELGFESAAEDLVNNSFFVNRAMILIQVDGRVTAQNRKRLEKILLNHLISLGFGVRIEWSQIQVPRIGQNQGAADRLKQSLQTKIKRSLQKVINQYCPDSCLLSRTLVEGSLITPDQAESLTPMEIISDPTTNTTLRIDSVDVDVEIDSALPEAERQKIINIMKAKTRYAIPVTISPTVVAFPETYSSKQKKLSAESKDPYGLEKLRRMLVMFRDLAGTKELITTNSSKESSSSKSSLDSRHSQSDSIAGSWITGVPNWMLIIGALAILLMLAFGVVLRISHVNRDASYMMQASEPSQKDEQDPYQGERTAESQGASHVSDIGELSLKMRNDEIRDELIDVFMNAPRVAKETFGRMLHEEGVEITAKYVHIFGHLIVFELLGDPNLSRGLFELSEYYHKSKYDFSIEEIFDLLMSLRTKVTANKIKVLTKKTMDQYDFLLKLDSTQIYNLVIDEKSAVQSIVLTQLDHKRRRSVFELFEGDEKVGLMRELCRADAIPKEYLSNVAKALHKKVLAKPEFDTENLRSADILLDLLEKSTLGEQRALMGNLNQTNQDAARAIKLKLVTIEMLPFLKDGHLLELILGLERENLVTFLAGTSERIRDLFLSKAPEELADSWIEDLEHVAGVDEGRYRLVEMQILGRIRNLASNGGINLLDINDMIFADDEASLAAENLQEISPDHLVA